MADKVLEVAAPAVSADKLHSEVSTEIEELHTEVSRLQKLVHSLDQRSRFSRSTSTSSRHGSSPSHRSPTLTPPASHCVGIMPNSGNKLDDADLLVTVS